MAAVLCLCFPCLIFALNPNKSLSQYLHAEWGPEKGFLGGQVYAIAQSKDGYLWIGADRGLVRFDGYRFVMMQQPIPDAPPIGPVRGLVTDGGGALWIRLDGKRLLRYQNGVFEDMLAHADVQFADVTAMSLDRQGHLLIAGLGDKLFEFHDGRFDPIARAEDTPGTVLALAQSKDGAIWIGTRDGGLYCLAGGHVKPVPGLLGKAKINALVEASNGGIWVGSDTGLFALDSGGQRWTNLPKLLGSLKVLSLARDGDGNVWAGTDRGLLRINHSRQLSFKPLADAAQDVTSIYVDRDADLWYGGSESIGRIRNGMFTAWTVADGLPGGENGALYVDPKGRTWIAPFAGGLYWFQDGEVHQLTNDGLAHDVVYSITGGGREIWLGRQGGGLTELIDEGSTFRSKSFTVTDGLPENTVFSVHRNRDGTVWAASSAGISYLKDGIVKRPVLSPFLAATTVNSMIESADGTMWFATSNGLAFFSHGRWASFGMHDGLPSSFVQTVYEDSRQTLWIATTAGLAYMKTGQIKVLHHPPEALREPIFGIAEDSFGELWFGTPDRILQVNRDQIAGGVLRETDLQSFGATDGLPGIVGIRRDRYLVSDSLGRVWISLRQGIAEANPGFALTNAALTGVRIDDVQADGLELSRPSMSRIASGTRSIAFHFSSTNLSDPSRIRFRYKLDGSDHGWSEIVDVREVIYRNLGFGPYHFRVVASSPEGLWNGPETTVHFYIERAFWQTWWFRSCCFAACIFVAFFLYRLRMHQVKTQLRTRFQARFAERTRIAQELHDTLLQSFQGLMLRFQSVDEIILSSPADAKKALEGALDIAEQALVESRDAIQEIRSVPKLEIDLAGTLNTLMSQLAADPRCPRNVPPSTTVFVEGQPRTVNSRISEELCRIAREALRNAFTHADAQHIEAEISYSDRFLRLRFRDDGVGIDPVVLRNGGRAGHWGLTGMNEMAKAIRARLSIWSKPKCGTEVEISVPAYIAFERKAARGPFRRFWRDAMDL